MFYRGNKAIILLSINVLILIQIVYQRFLRLAYARIKRCKKNKKKIIVLLLNGKRWARENKSRVFIENQICKYYRCRQMPQVSQ